MEGSTLSGNARQDHDPAWSRRDLFSLALWATGVVIVAGLAYQLVLASTADKTQETAAGLFLIIVTPALFGIAAGALIRPSGPHDEVVLFAAVDAACVAAAVFLQAGSPQCPPPDAVAGCEQGYLIGAPVVGAVCLVPSLAGAAIGRDCMAVASARSVTQSGRSPV
jgi:hypothetical protein